MANAKLQKLQRRAKKLAAQRKPHPYSILLDAGYVIKAQALTRYRVTYPPANLFNVLWDENTLRRKANQMHEEEAWKKAHAKKS